MKGKNYGFLFFLASYFILHTTFGQSQLTGRVIDSLSQESIGYGVVSLFYTETNKPASGALADSSGGFIVNNIEAGNYFLKAEFIGYETKFIRDIVLQKNDQRNLGTIVLREKPHALDEVTVSGQKDETAVRIDKQVYKAEQFQAAKGGTAIDVLKNMPSITVNSEGEIRLRGATGFLVLINGKPVVTDATTVLSQIPANTVENIEIITAPSARYDADGKAGIINITLKKGTDDGWSLLANGQGGLPSVNSFDNLKKPQRYGGDLSVNYKKNKWEVSAGGSYQQNDLAGRRVGDVTTTIDNRYTSFPSSGERSFQRRNFSARAAVTFSPDKYNSITAGFYRGQRLQYRRADIDYANTKTDITTGQIIGTDAYFNSNLVKKQGDFSLANLDYTHTFKNKSSLSISGLYEYALLAGYTKNLNANLLNHSDTLDYVLNTGRSPLEGLRGKVDYAIPLGKGKLETGYQFRYQTQTGSFLYENALLGTGQYQVVPEFSADIRIVNRIHGVYSQYAGKVGKLEYLAGLRYEYSTRTFDSDKQADPYQLDLSNLFPSANLLYRLNKGWKAKAGFSSRVQRSTNNELNPYPEREHSETLEQGDPHIKPEFVYLTEAGLSKEFTKGSFFFTLYNQQIRNVVNRVNSVYNDTILNRIYTNAGNATQWGLEAGVNLKPVKWWSFYAGGNLYNYSIKGSLFNNAVAVSNSAVAYSLNTNHTFQLAKTLSVQFNLNFLSLRPTAQGEDSRFVSPNLSVKKTFLDGRWTAMLQWQNIGLGFIPSNEQRITTRGVDFYTTTNYIQEKDVFVLNLGFNFNKSNKKIKLPGSEFGEREF